MAFTNHYKQERKQDWTTPVEFLIQLHNRFDFTLDGACDESNCLLPKGNMEAAPISWSGERVFCNPPWSNIAPFIEMAVEAEIAVFLVPARVNAKWFHRGLALGGRVEFFQGRPRFGDIGKGESPFDCVLLIFEKGGTCQ